MITWKSGKVKSNISVMLGNSTTLLGHYETNYDLNQSCLVLNILLDRCIYLFFCIQSPDHSLSNQFIHDEDFYQKIYFSMTRNGGSTAAPLIGKYCGKSHPKEIPSHTNKLFLKFQSDMSKTSGGFELEWTSASTGS